MTRSKHSKAPVPEAAAIFFPVAAIGACLANVPQESGIAHGVTLHLDPAQKAMLPELLQRATSFPVTEITHQASSRAPRRACW
ncbi:chemotaxis protein CheB [Janthinobacterium sp. HLX7-2]|uniref:chemotaxis protein CheB n=1 Tax=Janthinobacterium sp. HLX7-2 TaxID=1259331 RepID=UPI003F2239E3